MPGAGTAVLGGADTPAYPGLDAADAGIGEPRPHRRGPRFERPVGYVGGKARHRGHRFGAVCGARSDLAPGGWQRDGPACGTRHLPRADPVARQVWREEPVRAFAGLLPDLKPARPGAIAQFILRNRLADRPD